MVTFLLRFADLAGLASSWRSTDALETPAAMRIDVAAAAPAIAALGAAAPTPAAGEGIELAIDRALEGALASRADEPGLARDLGAALLDPRLCAALVDAHAAGARPMLRVQPSPSVAGVPWALLALPDTDDVRLLDVADVTLLPPAAIAHDPRRRSASTPSGGHLRVLDPRVPGQSAHGALGSVLGRPSADGVVARHLATRLADTTPSVQESTELQRRQIDRDELSRLLHERPASMLFAGHVSVADDGDTRQTVLHLACEARSDGLAATIGDHRPLAAADLLDDAVSGGDRWPMPPRVGLVACHSIGELGFDEAFGVSVAMITAGAEQVLATTWTMPTDRVLDGRGAPFSELVVAADDILRADDAARRLSAWQRERRAAWVAHGRLADAPLWWAGLALLDARPTELTWAR